MLIRTTKRMGKEGKEGKERGDREGERFQVGSFFLLLMEGVGVRPFYTLRVFFLHREGAL